MRKFILFGAFVLPLLPLCACWPDREDSARILEREIRTAVMNETAALATLTCIFRITYTSFKERLIFSDKIYVQQDEAALDYGYRLDEGNIKVVFEDGRKVLQVRLPKGELLGVNRYTLKTESSHDFHYTQADVDAEINRELESLENEYGERALREASQNIKNFFRIVAAKYDLELDFAIR